MPLNETGEWIMLNQTLPLEFPVFRLSIFYAKPVRHQLEMFHHYGHHYEYLDRVGDFNSRMTANYNKVSPDDYNKMIWQYLNGKTDFNKQVREEIEYQINRYKYSLDRFESEAEIVTPFGAAIVKPQEYNQVSLDYALGLADDDAYMIRYLNNDGSTRDNMKNVAVSEKVFYLQTRGIEFSEAMKMVSGEIKTQYLMYFDPLPQYVAVFERNILRKLEKKQSYCKEHGFEQLLEYESDEDGNFTLSDYIEHLTKQNNHAYT